MTEGKMDIVGWLKRQAEKRRAHSMCADDVMAFLASRYDEAAEAVGAIEAERDQLRAEIERLRADVEWLQGGLIDAIMALNLANHRYDCMASGRAANRVRAVLEAQMMQQPDDPGVEIISERKTPERMFPSVYVVVGLLILLTAVLLWW